MGAFKTVLLCEDIREEVGNKKSLMGVIPGDLIVSQFPATLTITFYLEYVVDATDNESMSFQARVLSNDVEIARGTGGSGLKNVQIAVFVLPRVIATFDKEGTLRLVISVNSGTEIEVVSKRVLGASPTSSPS